MKKLSWANIKAALSGLYVLLAGKAGGQTIIGDTASGGHLTLKATSHTTQGIVRIDNGARINSVATEEYVRARGMSLISNGSGLMYNNNNFSSYTFDSTDTASGGGSFRINGTYVAAQSDELIPVDTLGARYVLSLLAKAGDVGGGNFNPANKQYFGVALYDADGLSISSPMGAKFTGSTDTTLAVALNPGDTTITLTDATGWNSTGAVAGRNFAWYGYSNSFGYTYPNYTYTRNISNSYGSNNSLGAWASGGISGNVITLRVPWTGPALAAGAAVRNVGTAGSYKYIALAAGTVPNAWTPYSGFIGGIASDSSDGDTNFRHGTAFVKFIHLINYHAGGADTNIRLSTLKLSVVSSANLEDRIGVGAAYKLLITSSLPTNGLAVEGKAGFGTTSPVAQVHAESTSEQFRAGYSSTQYYKSVTSSTGVTTITLVGTTPAATFSVSDATTNAVYPVFGVSKNCAGAGAAGIGSRFDLKAKSSTTDDTLQASFLSISLSATHATRTNAAEIGTWDWTGYRAGFRCEADGTQVKTSVNGVSAVARASALTAEIPGDATRDELRLTELYNACKAFGIIN
ncbi:MAG: hypothetical protein IPM06_19230 [Rhizobiales bacterium]|nr:hypothetical protein [Hyphomicrobiales bacterium]